MPTAYTWQFVALDVFPTHNGLTNVVESIHWRLTEDDGLGRQAESYGEQLAGPPDPDNFTPFAELTALQVQGWTETQMGSELDQIKADIDNRIAQQISPTVVAMQPPWLP